MSRNFYSTKVYISKKLSTYKCNYSKSVTAKRKRPRSTEHFSDHDPFFDHAFINFPRDM